MKQNDRTMDILAVVMLVYQGWRVVDYMTSNLADVSSTTRIIISAAFLAFTEGALLAWLHKGRPNATTGTQEFIATSMVWIDFALSMVIGLGDLAVHNTFYKVDLTVLDPILFIAPWFSVVLNIGAYVGYKLADSEEQLEKAERQLEHAEHQLEIEARHEALKLLRKGKAGLAQELAPHYAERIGGNVTGRTLARFGKKQQPPHSGEDIQVNYNADAALTERLNDATRQNGKSSQTNNYPNS